MKQNLIWLALVLAVVALGFRLRNHRPSGEASLCGIKLGMSQKEVEGRLGPSTMGTGHTLVYSHDQILCCVEYDQADRAERVLSNRLEINGAEVLPPTEQFDQNLVRQQLGAPDSTGQAGPGRDGETLVYRYLDLKVDVYFGQLASYSVELNPSSATPFPPPQASASPH